MSSKTSLLRPLALAALLAVSGAAQATITVYTSLAAFTLATANPGTDTFAGFSIVDITPGPITRSAGVHTYSADAGPGGGFFGGGTTANPSLGPLFAEDTITFYGFSSGVAGLGGNFFGSDVLGAYALGDVRLTATDASGTVVSTIVSATESSFLGFVSTTGLLTATLAAVQPTPGFLWPSADNLVLATAVPEPGTYAMMLAGLGALGFLARRRRG